MASTPLGSVSRLARTRLMNYKTQVRHFALSDFDRYWEQAPRDWENIVFGNHPKRYPAEEVQSQRIRPVDGVLQIGDYDPVAPVSQQRKWRVRCTLFKHPSKSDDTKTEFTIHPAVAMVLSKEFALRSAVIELTLENERTEAKTTHRVICRRCMVHPYDEYVEQMNFVEFIPNAINKIHVPIKVLNFTQGSTSVEKWWKRSNPGNPLHDMPKWQQYRKEIEMTWYGDDNTPGYLSVDVNQLTQFGVIKLSDVHLPRSLRPIDPYDSKHTKLLSFLPLPERGAHKDERELGPRALKWEHSKNQA